MFQPQAVLPVRPNLLRKALALTLLVLALGAPAAETCTWDSAAERYAVNAQVLYAIAVQESSLNPGVINKNTNGTHDIGLMQINSRWLPYLSKFGITSTHLLDPCLNLHVGAHILALSMARYGNTWQAIGAYHSTTPALRDRYALSIYRRLSRLGVVPKLPAS